MKKQTIAIFAGIILIIILATILFTRRSHPKYGAQVFENNLPLQTNQNNKESSVNPSVITPTPDATKTIEQPHKAYSEEVRTKARKDFLAECTAKLGSQKSSVCECSADYLASHYSDLELVQMYLKFHSTRTVTKEMQSAYDACEKN